MPRLSKIGAAALAAFGWTSGSSAVSTSYLVVAGGGSGAVSGANTNVSGGGGGAGGYLTGTTSLNSTLSYTVTVGAGAPAVFQIISVSSLNLNGAQGSSSTFNAVTATGGGYGGAYNTAGGNGGSGGGGGAFQSAGTATSGQGSNGGTGFGGGSPYPGGGGGGSSAVGANATISQAGAGGAGTANSITGTSVTYAGGGGSGGTSGGAAAGAGGSGGGGTGGAAAGNGNPGTANLGGGGGASGGQAASSVVQSSGNGGSGVVIISYPSPQRFGGGIVTTSGSNTIHTFQTSGTLSPLSTLTASYLIVAGGGSGGWDRGGGGGAGGYLTGSGLTIDTNSNYVVTVGAGGASSTSTGVRNSGSNSSFSAYATASVGGGAGGSGSNANGLTGGSGGGAFYGGSVGAGTSGQGYAGGLGDTSYFSVGGGGGGASQVGYPATTTNPSGPNQSGGNGGNGLANSISGTSTYYAGGGGGGVDYRDSGVAGTGGLGGGGNAIKTQGGAGSAGTANTGGGGGAGGEASGGGGYGGAGGSGIVIISYAGSVQQMAGGTVTISGGNVIHTFTSSGYLTPLKYVGNSLRFRSSASANLTRQPTTSGSQTTATYSFWMKRGKLGVASPFHTTKISSAGTNATVLQYNSSDQLSLIFASTGGTNYINSSTAVYRDPAAWYHVVVAIDTTQASSANRLRAYVNGVEITSWASSSIPPQSTNLTLSLNTLPMNLGTDPRDGTYYDGYMTEVNFIDGQQLTPNSFGTFNSYGVWQPITYGGSYGTNGFYLPFTNKTSTTTLGYDFSPAGNNWTTNNISLTAGSTYDSMTDVPTLTSATAANYCTWNPALGSHGTTPNINAVITNGNLTATDANNVTYNSGTSGTMGFTSGKWYWENTIGNSGPTFAGCGVSFLSGSDPNQYGLSFDAYTSSGAFRAFVNGTPTNIQTSLGTLTGGDVVAIALDCGAQTIAWYKNNVQLGTTVTYTSYLPTNATFIYPGFWSANQSGASVSTNFGQQPYKYTPPSGFVALNTYNI